MNDLLGRLEVRFAALEEELNALDALAGDGDHGSTMLRGFRAAEASEDPASAFRQAAGGASGALMAQILAAVLAHTRGEPLDEALSAAASRIAAIGQAKAGDRTLLDALIPASHESDPDRAAEAARMGAEATRHMAARRGRARYVEGTGLGHVDAGARSVAEILTVLSESRT